jgi:hypothetical protein
LCNRREAGQYPIGATGVLYFGEMAHHLKRTVGKVVFTTTDLPQRKGAENAEIDENRLVVIANES